MMPGPLNGTAPELILTIRWQPTTGQIRFDMPQLDAVAILGLLEFAKISLIESRIKQADSKIAIPNIALPPGAKLT